MLLPPQMTFCDALNKVKVLNFFVILCFLCYLRHHQGESMIPSAKQQTFEMGYLRFFPWFSCCQVHSSYFSRPKAWRHNYQLIQLACHLSFFPNVEIKLLCRFLWKMVINCMLCFVFSNVLHI